ncbi:kinase-like domain, phloem protein 2-like protein [Tanacetum coccineum]
MLVTIKADNYLLKEDVSTVPIWVKIHGVPVTAFSGDGLSVIATKLGTPLMLDSYTSDMCMQSWARSSYARVMIEIQDDVELKDNIVVAMPIIKGEGYYTCNIHAEYEWKPPRCTNGGISNSANKGTNNVSSSNTLIGEKIDKIERQIYEGKLRVMDDDENPLVLTGIVESDSEVEVVFDKTANLRISTSGKDGSDKGYGTNSLLEQWRDSYPNIDDYDPYDDDMYENRDMLVATKTSMESVGISTNIFLNLVRFFRKHSTIQQLPVPENVGPLAGPTVYSNLSSGVEVSLSALVPLDITSARARSLASMDRPQASRDILASASISLQGLVWESMMGSGNGSEWEGGDGDNTGTGDDTGSGGDTGSDGDGIGGSGGEGIWGSGDDHGESGDDGGVDIARSLATLHEHYWDPFVSNGSVPPQIGPGLEWLKKQPQDVAGVGAPPPPLSSARGSYSGSFVSSSSGFLRCSIYSGYTGSRTKSGRGGDYGSSGPGPTTPGDPMLISPQNGLDILCVDP